MRRRPSVSLSLSRLDDRITPSAVAPIGQSRPYPEYWTESKFLPTQSTPAADGGTWVIGTTQTAGRYSWWGNSNADWAVVKLTAVGTIDPAFNGGKVKNLDSGPLEWFSFQDLRSGPDGTLYTLARNVRYDWDQATGAAPVGLTPPPQEPDEDFAVVRFNPDGLFDTTFDGDGMALFDRDARDGRPYWDLGFQAEFAVGADGSVAVATVRVEYPFPTAFTVDILRLTREGTPDATFDGDGRASLSVSIAGTMVPPAGVLVGVDVAPDGSVTLGGSWNVYPYYNYLFGSGGPDYSGVFAARLTTTGAADGTFDSDGVATFKDSITGDNSGLTVNDFAVGADGIYFVGTKRPQGNPLATYPFPQVNEAVVIRLDGTGQLDATFDADGVAFPTFGDGRLVTAGDRITPLPGGGVAIAGRDMRPPPTPVNGDLIAPFVDSFVIGVLMSDGSVDPDFTPIRPTTLGYGFATDLDALADGGLSAVVEYPIHLIATDADGGEFTTITVPYDRRGPWQPPPDFVPFPRHAVVRSDRGDLNGDGTDDYVYVTAAGAATGVRIVDGFTGDNLITDFMPYEASFTGGQFVAVDDFDGDGRDDLVVSPDDGGSARVQVFTFEAGRLVQQANYFAIEDSNFRGGGSIAISDTNGDGTPDLLVGAAKGGSQRIATFDGKTLFGRHSLPPVLHGDYFAPLPGVDPATYRGGVSLRTQDVNGDGLDDIVMAPAEDESNAVVLFHSTSDGRTFRYRTLATASLGPDQTAGLFEYDMATNVSRSLG